MMFDTLIRKLSRAVRKHVFGRIDRTIREQGVTSGANVHLRVFDVERAQTAAENAGFEWSSLRKHERRHMVESFGERTRTARFSNVTCTALHESMATSLVPSARVDAPEPVAVAFGDGTTSFATTDTTLNNRVGSVSLTDPSHAGNTFAVSEYVDSLELNGNLLAEVGIEDEAGRLWNHAPIPDPIDKTTAAALIVNIEIPMNDHP